MVEFYISKQRFQDRVERVQVLDILQHSPNCTQHTIYLVSCSYILQANEQTLKES